MNKARNGILMRKTALLFLTNGELNHSRFWQDQLSPYLDRFSIYIHSQQPLQDPFFKHFRIKEIVPTTELHHVKAWQALLREAILDQDNVKFIFLSEACLPLYPLDILYEYIQQDSQTHMQVGSPWWEEHEPRSLLEFPKEHRYGNSEWLILNRKHAQLIVEDKEIIEIASRHIHDAESYPSTFLSLKGCLNEIVSREVTFAKPNLFNYPHVFEFKEPNQLLSSLFVEATSKKALFMRKFHPQFPPDTFLNLKRDNLKRYLYLEELSLANFTDVLASFITQMGLKIGCELGVFCGFHLISLLEKTNVHKVYGIDTFANRKNVHLSIQDWKEVERFVKKALSPYEPRTELWCLTSREAAKKIDDYSLDFVFINDLQCEESLSEILPLWVPKIKHGGLLAGYHAISDDSLVPPEVNHFLDSQGIKAYSINHIESGFWWAILP